MRLTINNLPEIPSVDFIGGVFPKRQLSILASEPGTGKTWVMLKFSADISNECHYGKFFGQSFMEKSRKSLMLIGDTGKEMIAERIKLLKLSSYVKEPNFVMYFVSDMIVQKVPFLLNTIEGRSAIQGLIHYEKPDIVFFDTLISFMTADENSSKEVGEMFIGLREMAEEENCAIVLSHHFRKTNALLKGGTRQATLNDVIGSSAISRLSSLMIAMVKDKTKQERNEVTVTCVKSWYKPISSFTFEIVSYNDTEVNLIPNYYKGSAKKASELLKKMASQLPDGLMITFDDIKAMTGLPKSSIGALLKTEPRLTPLTDAPTCDRVYVTNKKKRM